MTGNKKNGAENEDLAMAGPTDPFEDEDYYDEREMSYMTCQICKRKQVVQDEANEVSKVQQNQTLLDVVFSKGKDMGIGSNVMMHEAANTAKTMKNNPKDLISLLLNQKCQCCDKYTCEKCLDECDACGRATCRMCI